MNPVLFVTDSGIEGDCHGRPGSRRQVLLIEAETLDFLGVPPGAVKENITTWGINLMGLQPGTRLLLGEEAVLWITGACAPCALMDDVRPGLEEELQGRRGVLAWVQKGGRVFVGDPIRVLRESAADV